MKGSFIKKSDETDKGRKQPAQSSASFQLVWTSSSAGRRLKRLVSGIA